MTDWPVRPLPNISAALRDVTSNNESARLAATATLSDADEAHRSAAVSALGAALDDPSSRVRAQAALALAELDPRPHSERLIELIKDDDGRVGQAAIIALGESGLSEVMDVLAEALDAKDADIRFQAVLAIARVAGESSLDALGKAATDEDAEVRANVAAALADIDVEACQPLLRKLVTDSAKSVRVEAALALARRRDERATPVLIEALGDADLAPQAVRGLGLLGDSSAREPLRQLMNRWMARAPLRAAAAAALAALGDGEGRREHGNWLESKRREPRAMAIYCAGELKLAFAVEQLCTMLGDSAMTDRDTIATALGQIGELRAIEALENALSDSDPDVATEARSSLETLQAKKSNR